MTRSSALVLLLAGSAAAQQGSGLTPRERQLEVRRAEVDEQQASATLQQAKKLFAEGLMSQFELNRAQAEWDRARISREKALLALANELPAFQIRWARKLAGERGEVRVRLALETLDAEEAGAAPRPFLVSLKSGSTIISSPYQTRVVTGRPGTVQEVEFVLLRDVEELTISFLAGSRHEEVQLVVPREDAGRGLRLSCQAVALEGAVGDKVEYAIEVERFTSAITAAALAVTGLPDGFTTEWVDAEAKARISELRFGEKQDRRRLTLRVFLPAEGNGGWLDKSLPLHVQVGGAGTSGTIPATLDLQLRVVGAPKLYLSADNLLLTLGRGEGRTILVTLQNDGGGEARDVQLEVSAPAGAEATADPATVAVVRPHGRVSIRLTVRADRDAVRGEYGLKVRANSQSRQAAVESPDLSFRVEIGGSSGSSTAWMAGLLLLATGLTVTWGIRRIRR